MSYRRYVRLGFRQPRRFYPCSTTPSHATFSDSEAVLKIKIHMDVRQGNTSILLGLCTSVLMDENHTKYLAYDFCFLAYSAFPRSYFVCLWSAMRYVQKNLFFSPATFLTDEGLMTRELCTVVQVSRPCHQYRNCV